MYAVAAGIDPKQVLPVALDTGCDVDEVRGAPFYAGLPRRRARCARHVFLSSGSRCSGHDPASQDMRAVYGSPC